MKLWLLPALLLGILSFSVAQDEGSSESSEAESPAHDPLVRCKRPLCKMLCVYGMVEGEDGCPICQCKPSPCELLNCPEGEECKFPDCHGLGCLNVQGICVPKVECPMLKCNPCESNRYFVDQHGCQTCDCIPGPPVTPVIDPMPDCPVPMCANACPDMLYARNEMGCETCDCLLTPSPPPPPSDVVCSGVMCRMFCEYGFEKDERGCDMCRCRETKQEEKCECPSPLMECEMITDPMCALEPCDRKPKCSVPSLCSMAKTYGQDALSTWNRVFGTNLDVDLGRALSCKPSGEVSPRQCTSDGVTCWCVDDRGQYVDGSRRTRGDVDEDMCASRKTLMMQLAFQLVHDLEQEDINDALEDIKELVRSKLTQWLGMDQDVVLRIQVTVVGPGLVGVDISVLSDGLTDMPKAALLMNHHLADTEGCRLSLGEHTLTPKAGSLQTKHIYDLDDQDVPQLYVDRVMSDDQFPWQIVLYPVLGALLLVAILATIICAVRHKKYTASYQFQHKKLENMENFQKNLILSSEWDRPDLVCKDNAVVTVNEVEKKPLA